MNSENRNYATISPSAKMLLLLKGYTDIPYMKAAATLAMLPEVYVPDMHIKDARFWARVLHFEERYKSVNQLLEGLDTGNVLELSSGFSFRGLDRVQHQQGHYIDTDLPDVIDAKQQLVAAMTGDAPLPEGLELLPLNALDAAAFNDIVSRFPGGPLAIVNEGLLMYLGHEEKKQLAAIIHSVLQQRGGWWITADIYRRMEMPAFGDGRESREEAFFREHNIDANKFDSFEVARQFFTENGFVIDKEAVTDHSRLVSLPYFMSNVPELKLEELRDRGKIRVSWRLRAV